MTWDARRVMIEPGSTEWNAIVRATTKGEPIVLQVEEGHTEPDLNVGDMVEVPFDYGYGPAKITGLHQYGVAIKYGPGWKYTTSIPRSSVRTTRRIEHAAKVTVITDE